MYSLAAGLRVWMFDIFIYCMMYELIIVSTTFGCLIKILERMEDINDVCDSDCLDFAWYLTLF